MLMFSILHSAIPQKIRHKSSNEIAESHDQLAISQRRKRIVYDTWGADKAFDVSKWHWRSSKQWITNWTPVQYLIRGFHISSWPSSVWPATSLCPALQVRKRVKHEIATIPFMTDRESIEVLLKISRARLSVSDTNFKHLFSARPSSLYLQIAWSQSTPEVSSSFRYSVGPRTQTLTCTSFAHLAMTLSFHPEFCNANKCSFQCHHSSEFLTTIRAWNLPNTQKRSDTYPSVAISWTFSRSKYNSFWTSNIWFSYAAI